MSTSFAGSRCLDERRRRRLAGEADVLDGQSPALPTDAPGGADDDPSADAAPPAGVSHFPLGRLISRKLWKLWAVGLLILLAGGNILLAGSAVAGGEMRLGPGFASLFKLPAARVLRPLATLLLLLCAQLAWLIWWVRSRSPHDFDGRYRLWGWCAALGVAATFAHAIDLHLAWAQTALWLWDFDVWNKETLVWLLPLVLAAAWALRIMHREMRDCKLSHTLLWMAALCGLGVALLNLHVIPLPFSLNEKRLLHWSAELTACWLLFMCLLMHARHVVHVTADAAQIRPSKFSLRSLLRWPKRQVRQKQPKRHSAPSKAAETSKPKKESKPPAPAKPPAARKKKKPRRTQSTGNNKKDKTVPQESGPETAPAVPVPEEPIELTDAVDDKAPATPSTPKQTPAAESQPHTLPLEPATAGDSMKGLSKRERRRLRKQQREAQSQRRAA